MAKGRYDEVDLSRVKRSSIKERKSLVSISDLGTPVKGGKSFRKWFDSLPGKLGAERLRSLVKSIRRARMGGNRQIIWMIGAHLLKCGLSPYIIELMKKGYITSLAMNGACLIHDLELAFFGQTSEDVEAGLRSGTFGFVSETADLAFRAADGGARESLGLGESMGRSIMSEKAEWKDYSLLGQAYRLGIPATVHVAFGTDIFHQHSEFDPSSWGELTGRDFRIFASRVESLGRNGGVAINVGSAVIMPEVFLKAFSVARNLGAEFKDITTCNLDMISHYRPSRNVLERPASFGGESISLTGHHEIMIPLIYSALLS